MCHAKIKTNVKKTATLYTDSKFVEMGTKITSKKMYGQ